MSEQVPGSAGWMNDPYGRFQQRYFDGTGWTADVATNGVQQVDPLGNSPVVPFATPPTAYTTPGESTTATQGIATTSTLPATNGNGITRFLDSMGPDAAERPRPSFGSAVAGIGGFLLGAGFLIITLGDEVTRGKSIAVTLILLAAAAALRWFVKTPVVQAAAVGVAVLAIPSFAAALTIDDGQAKILTYLLATVLFLAAWALRPFKGRTLLLGLGALMLVGTLSTIVTEITKDDCETYIQNGDFDSFIEECQDYDGDGGSSFLPVGVTDNVGQEGAVYLFSAALLLGATWWLDRRGYRGTATGTVVAGLLSAVGGTILLAGEFGSDTGPVLVFVVGVLVCVVGSHGSRRATTWWGALLASIGLVSFVAVQWEPDSVTATGGVAVVSGLILMGLAFFSGPLLAAISKREPAAPSSFAPPDTPASST